MKNGEEAFGIRKPCLANALVNQPGFGNHTSVSSICNSGYLLVFSPSGLLVILSWSAGIGIALLFKISLVSIFVLASPILISSIDLSPFSKIFLWPVVLLIAICVELVRSNPKQSLGGWLSRFLLWFSALLVLQLLALGHSFEANEDVVWKSIRDLFLAGASVFLGMLIAHKDEARLQAKFLLRLLVSTAILITLVNVVGILSLEEFPMIDNRNRIIFPSNDPNLLAIYLFFATVALMLVKVRSGPFFLILGSKIIAGQALTGSRAAFLVTIVFWYFALVVDRSSSINQKAWGFLGGGIAVLWAFSISSAHHLSNGLYVGIFARTWEWSLDAVARDGRVERVTSSLASVTSDHFALFFGLGMRQGASPHNVYVQIFSEFGLLGGAIIAVPVVLLLRKAWIQSNLIVLIGALGFSGLSLFQSYLQVPLLWFLPALYLGRGLGKRPHPQDT